MGNDEIDAELSWLESLIVETKAESKCPPATTDIAVNLRNRQKAIDSAGYGPLNPKMANNDFWKKKAERWDVRPSEAKGQVCGNCAAFIKTPRILSCIEGGLGNEAGNAAWDVIDAGDLGYCEAFDFKCASRRTCDAWIVGGPITEEKGQQETKSGSFDPFEENPEVESYIDELSDEELDALFPESEQVTDEEAKWLFDVGGAFLRRTLTNRRKRKRRMFKSDDTDIGIESKGDKKPLRDPKGGLTAAGRAFYKRTEGANLKPGVRGPADTPQKMRRKGSFLVRFFSNPRGPMKDEKGRPTRLALSAAAWGEPVPQDMESAKRLAEKGRNLLERYSRYKKRQTKSDIESDGTKALGPTIGSSNSQRQQQPQKRSGSTVSGRPISSAGSLSSNYDPNARDADGDGSVQEGTDYVRPAQSNANRSRSRGNAAQRTRGEVRRGSADAMEGRARQEERRRTGRGEGYDKIGTQEEMDAYRRSYGLEPKPFNSPKKRRSGTADSMEGRARQEERRRTGRGEGYDEIDSQEEMDAYRRSYGLD